MIVVLLGSLLLPWEREFETAHLSIRVLGISRPSGTVAALLVLALLRPHRPRAGRPTRSLFRLRCCSSSAVCSTSRSRSDPHVGELARPRPRDRPRARSRSAARRSWRSPAGGPWLAVASTLLGGALVTSLFLPWQTVCYGSDSGFRGGAGSQIAAARAANLRPGRLDHRPSCHLPVVAAIASAGPLVLSRPELCAGLALLVATAESGLERERGNIGGVHVSLGYGAIACFAATGALIVRGLARAAARRGFRAGA